MDTNLLHQLNMHALRGGKTSRRRQVARVKQMLSEIGKTPQQIGRGDLYSWIEGVEAETTRRDRFYAAVLFWKFIYKKELPPPICLKNNQK